jgi:hypothetical protein
MKTLLLLLFASTLLFSAPAFNAMREFTNADGTTFMAKAQGNQHLNWIQTQDGEILKYNQATKSFEYAKIEGDRLLPSGIKYENNALKKAAARKQVNKIDKSELSNLWSQRQKAAHERTKGLLQD